MNYPLEIVASDLASSMEETLMNLRLAFGERILSISCSPTILYTTNTFSEEELTRVRDIIAKRDKLDNWEPSKLRHLTIDQINARHDALDSEIDAIKDLPSAKALLKKIEADNRKRDRILLFLLKREMKELR